MSDQVLLRDLVVIPDTVHDGDFVLTLARGVQDKSTITDYVVTEPLAQNFDKALDLIKSALEVGASRAAYLNGSFGSGKSHFMAVLHAILKGDPDARGKKGLADVVAKHDRWLTGRRFLLVPYHLPDSQSLDAAILGGYVAHVAKEYKGAALPAVYRDDSLIADAAELRQQVGDDKFIALLPATDAEAQEWGTTGWDTASLDRAFAEPQDGPERRRLVGDLLVGPFQRYAGTVRADQASYIEFDEGLSVISQHAKNVLGCDAIVLLLDELVLWLAGFVADPNKIHEQVQKVSKLTESAAGPGPRRSSASSPASGTCATWSARRPPATRSPACSTCSSTGTAGSSRSPSTTPTSRRSSTSACSSPRTRPPGPSSTPRSRPRQGCRRRRGRSSSTPTASGGAGRRSASPTRSVPRSPTRWSTSPGRCSASAPRSSSCSSSSSTTATRFRSASSCRSARSSMSSPRAPTVRSPISSATSSRPPRSSTPSASARPCCRRTASPRSRPGQLGPRHPFRADDLIVKTLLLAALVPNVPALNGLTATRLAALNHGSIVSMVRNQERAQVSRTLKYLSTQFGEVRLSGSEDDPRVDLALIGVDTDGIIRDNRHADDDAARRRLVRDLVWAELNLKDEGAFETRTTVTWRGTARTVEVLMDNVSDPDRMPTMRFQADPGTIRMIIDYPFDDGDRFPADDVRRVHELKRPARRGEHHRLAAALPLRGPQGRPVHPHRHQLPART